MLCLKKAKEKRFCRGDWSFQTIQGHYTFVTIARNHFFSKYLHFSSLKHKIYCHSKSQKNETKKERSVNCIQYINVHAHINL